MSISVTDQIGDTIAAEINTQQALGSPPFTAPQSYTAVRADVELQRLEALSGMQVLVIADANQSNELLTHGKVRGFRYRFALIVYARLTGWTEGNDVAANNALIDPYKLYCEQLQDWFGKANTLSGWTGATVDGQKPQLIDDISLDPFPEFATLLAYGVFLSVLNITVYLLRQM